MITATPLSLRRVARLGLVTIFVLLSSPLFADLIIERHQGGPMQYNGNVGPVKASFDLLEATRIQKVQFWMRGEGPALVLVGAVPPPEDSPGFLFGESFDMKEPPIVDSHSDPGIWQGISSLKWDLQPGTYEIYIDAGDLPFSLGYAGPLHPVPQPYDYVVLQDEDWQPLFGGFGVRIYGTSLSAVPEPATYGLLGGVGLLLAIHLRRYRWLPKILSSA